jgi:hypothetical protein
MIMPNPKMSTSKFVNPELKLEIVSMYECF